MPKYKVEFNQTETFAVTVTAKNEEDAKNKAFKKFNGGEYEEYGDCDAEIGDVIKL